MDNNINYQPMQNGYVPMEAPTPELLRKRVKKSYGWGTLSMVLQFLIIQGASILTAFIYSAIAMAGFIAKNPSAATDQKMIMEFSQSIALSVRFILISTAISYLFGNILAFIIGVRSLKAFRAKDLFGKSRISSGSIVLGVFGILGIQAVSMFIQNIVMMLTGMSGLSEEQISSFGFSDDMTANVILLLYFVIIAPITEELIIRGFVMNALAPVNKKFALIASALLFGLMHGNFNQMFNGFLLGLILGYIALKSGSVLCSIILHMAANANAMICAYVYEYKLFGTMGEKAYDLEMIHFAVFLVIGIVCLVLLLKKHGNINENDHTVEYSIDTMDGKKPTWSLLVKCPSFWVITAIYVIIAISNINIIIDK